MFELFIFSLVLDRGDEIRFTFYTYLPPNIAPSALLGSYSLSLF